MAKPTLIQKIQGCTNAAELYEMFIKNKKNVDALKELSLNDWCSKDLLIELFKISELRPNLMKNQKFREVIREDKDFLRLNNDIQTAVIEFGSTRFLAECITEARIDKFWFFHIQHLIRNEGFQNHYDQDRVDFIINKLINDLSDLYEYQKPDLFRLFLLEETKSLIKQSSNVKNLFQKLFLILQKEIAKLESMVE